jgi:hypothetical protein
VRVKARLTLPAQWVDATPSNQLIRQYFRLENRSVRLYPIRTRQGGVSFESTLANDFKLLRPGKHTSSQCCVDPWRPPALSGVGAFD